LVLAGLRRAVTVCAVVAAVGMVLVAGLGIGSALLQERVSSITQITDDPDQSVTDRYTMWAAAVGMWRDHPLTGVGMKGFPEYRDGHASLALSSGSDIGGAGTAYQRQPLLSPHNMYALVLAEQGLVGLLTLAGSWLALLVCGVRAVVRGRRDPGGLGREGPTGPAGGPGGPDCGLVACGLLGWVLVGFVYGDIGGPSTVMTAVALGLAAWWALAEPASVPSSRVSSTGQAEASVPEKAGTR
jgi:O-antigen ligase